MKLYKKPRVKAPHPHYVKKMQTILKEQALTSVCEAAACPNRAECYARGSATFMILGNICTRSCAFCNVATGRPGSVDATEPKRLAAAVRELGLEYVVLTSVDRDDLKDCGVSHFLACVQALKEEVPRIKIELLTPDFKGREALLHEIAQSGVHKLAHNQESVRRLSKTIRPQSDYERSLRVLEYYAKHSSSTVKSSLMVGLGERKEELLVTMQELREAGVTELTIGQYLQPSTRHHPVVEYFSKIFFDEMRQRALEMGFEAVASGSLVRSSYFADRLGR